MSTAVPRILVVEDDPDWYEVYRELLEPQGYAVTLANTRDEALAALDASDEWWVVLIDRRLQGLDGPDEGTSLLAEVGARAPGAKSLTVTAYVDSAAIERAFALGVYDYIEKTRHFGPLLLAKVRNAVEAVRDRRLMLADREPVIADAWQRAQSPDLDPHARGRVLEELVLALFTSVPGFAYARSPVRNASQEFDVIVQNGSADPFWQREGAYFLVECKHWSAKVDPKELAHLREKARQRYGRCRLAFLVAWSGFTQGFERQRTKEATEDLLIVALDRDDLARLIDADDRDAELKRLHARAVTEEPA
ncbi:MAG: response regulator [Myxococcales bacterium]|nr:response regulator [Myxococcales bacterium]